MRKRSRRGKCKEEEEEGVRRSKGRRNKFKNYKES